MIYVVIAEGYARRAGRMEARTMGTVEAAGREEAERLAREKWPGLRLTVTPKNDGPGHSSPR